MSVRMSICTLLTAAFLAGCGENPAQPAKAARQPLTLTAAQASNAFASVEAFVKACTPRDGGTPGSERAAVWLNDRLAKHGVSVTIDRFADATPRDPQPFANVLATIPGESDEWVLLLSHFDTKSGIAEGFQGANDSGSSTGLLLELAELLQRAAPRKYSVLCAFLDGEECTFGYSDRDLKITVPRNGAAALRVLALEAAEATGDRAKIGLCDGEIFDDHQAFFERGYPAVDLIDFDYGSSPGANDYWHTPKDTLDKLSADSLFSTGRIVLEMLNRL